MNLKGVELNSCLGILNLNFWFYIIKMKKLKGYYIFEKIKIRKKYKEAENLIDEMKLLESENFRYAW